MAAVDERRPTQRYAPPSEAGEGGYLPRRASQTERPPVRSSLTAWSIIAKP
jgi:hypothetical protein